MPRLLPSAAALAILALAGPAAAQAGGTALDQVLRRQCAPVAGQLAKAAEPHVRCASDKARSLIDGSRSDGEVAGLALKACAAEAAPVRQVLGLCAGDQADAAMDAYANYSLNQLVLGLIRGRERALASQLATPAGKEGPVFDALADHLACVSISAMVAADALADREAAARQALERCGATRTAFETAARAGLKGKDLDIELGYGQRVALDEAHGEFDAAHREAPAGARPGG